MAERILRVPEVLRRVGAGRTSVYRWERDGKFPRRRQLGPGIVGWLETEIDEWLRSRPVAEGEGTGDAA